jgi:AcrR family transcriptional regulator
MAGTSGTIRRDRILAAAEREFATNGFSGARMDRIAARAGVNKQLLFHYFGSKTRLYQAAVAAGLEAAQLGLPPPGRPADRLRQFIGQLQAVTAASPALLTTLGSASGADASVTAAALADWYARALGYARQILEDGQRSGHFRDDADLPAIAELIVPASLGTMVPAAEPDRPGKGRARDRIREALVRLVIDYCAWR